MIAKPRVHAADCMEVCLLRDVEFAEHAVALREYRGAAPAALSLFPWAKFCRRKVAVKMHTLLDLHGNIPTFIRVTSGDAHDVNLLDEIMPEAGAFYVMDRGYIDFSEALRLYAQLGLLCRAHQVERAAPTALLASGGQDHGRALGSDGDSVVVRIGLGVSRCAAACELLRRGDQQATEIPDDPKQA